MSLNLCVGVGSVTSVVSDPATTRTAARQAPLSTGLSRQEYWSGLPFPPQGDLPDPGIELHLLCLLHWQESSLPLVPPGKLLAWVWANQPLGPAKFLIRESTSGRSAPCWILWSVYATKLDMSKASDWYLLGTGSTNSVFQAPCAGMLQAPFSIPVKFP